MMELGGNEDKVNFVVLRCRKCRKVIIEHPQTLIVSAHSEDVERVNKSSSDDCPSLRNTLWYLLDETVPSWVSLALEKGDWTRGKLSCPHCNARLGSFDFVSGSKCLCHKFILPSVHIVKEKVDKSYTTSRGSSDNDLVSNIIVSPNLINIQ